MIAVKEAVKKPKVKGNHVCPEPGCLFESYSKIGTTIHFKRAHVRNWSTKPKDA